MKTEDVLTAIAYQHYLRTKIKFCDKLLIVEEDTNEQIYYTGKRQAYTNALIIFNNLFDNRDK